MSQQDSDYVDQGMDVEEDDDVLVYDDISEDEEMTSESAGGDEDGNEEANEGDSSDGDDMAVDPSWVKLPSETTESHDWQIDVGFEGKPDAASSYMVHQSRFGTQSEYFNSLFRKDGFAESQTKTSCVEFPAQIPVDLDNSHLELFLDFLYDDLHPQWSEEEVLSLLYLADYFDVKALREECLVLIRYYLAFTTSQAWIAKAYTLVVDVVVDEDIQDTIAWVCRSNLEYFTGIWNGIATPELKRKLAYQICNLRNNAESTMDYYVRTEDKTRRWHKLVLHVIHACPEIVDANLFCHLTHRDVLRFEYEGDCEAWEWTDQDVAMEYLKHEQTVALDQSYTNANGLTNLQELCLKAIFANPSKSCEAKDTLDTLCRLKPAFLRSLLFRFLEKDPACEPKETMETLGKLGPEEMRSRLTPYIEKKERRRPHWQSPN